MVAINIKVKFKNESFILRKHQQYNSIFKAMNVNLYNLRSCIFIIFVRLNKRLCSQ